jgi:hypothetical protein
MATQPATPVHLRLLRRIPLKHENEQFRGVVWPRPPKDGKHRYVVIGMVVTDSPIEAFEDKSKLGFSEIELDGPTFGYLSDTLSPLGQKEVNRNIGCTSELLASLNELFDE